jgi:hypothetical protein
MTEDTFDIFVKEIVAGLNTYVFPKIYQALQEQHQIRAHLHPAFPFPRKIRVGIVDKYLAVEYIGPEEPSNDNMEVVGTYNPTMSIYEFLEIQENNIHSRKIQFPLPCDNMQVFNGEAMNMLSDYLYDIVDNPNNIITNGYPNLDCITQPTFISNVTFAWSDEKSSVKIRRIDFLELHPSTKDGWNYHTVDSLEHFADFLIQYPFPNYQPHLHGVLNDFIHLVSSIDADEPQITKYLSDHPEILQIAFGVNDLNPQTLLEWQYKTDIPALRPDFMPIRMDGFADILEFKLPRLKSAPIVGTPTREHYSNEIDTALAQIDEYSEWCAQEINRRWIEQTKGIKISNPHLLLIIGHTDDFCAEDRQRMRTRRNATIYTYNEFIDMARMQLYRIH